MKTYSVVLKHPFAEKSTVIRGLSKKDAEHYAGVCNMYQSTELFRYHVECESNTKKESAKDVETTK